MLYEPTEMLDLPTSEQLMAWGCLCSEMKDEPSGVSPLEQAAWRDIILGMYPGAGEGWEYGVIERLFPKEWRQYCEAEWGTPKELRADEEARLLAQGWERGVNGEMYFPFP